MVKSRLHSSLLNMLSKGYRRIRGKGDALFSSFIQNEVGAFDKKEAGHGCGGGIVCLAEAS